MKKAFKIIGITLASIVGVVVIAVVVVCNIVFSPSTLTPIVRDNVGRFISCDADLDTVDLTFFSSFPRFSLHATNVRLINPMDGAASDTLAYIGDVSASVNVTAFLFRQEVILDHFTLRDARANVYVDSAGRANYDIVPPSDKVEEEDSTGGLLLNMLQIESVDIEGLYASYTDRSMGVDARVDNMMGHVDGVLQAANGDLNADIAIEGIEARYNDSTCIYANISDARLTLAGALRDNHFDGRVALALPSSTMAMNGDTLAKGLALSVTLPAEYNFDTQHAALHNAVIAVNEHEITVDGPVQLKDQHGNVNVDLKAATNSWDIERLLALVPEAYADMLDGIDVAGTARIEATVRGVYASDTVNPQIPVVQARLLYTDGRVAYPEVMPYRLHGVEADLTADLNLNDGELSNATINALRARTGTMSVEATGAVKDLLGNLRADVNLKADVNLPELKPVMPSDLRADLKGRAKADVNAAFALNDLTEMRLDRIKANGKITYSDLDVVYNDSISVTDPAGTITINMPIAKAERQSPNELLQATIAGTDMRVDMTGVLNAHIEGPAIRATLSNPLDTTRLMTAHCSVGMEHLTGAMDTITFDIARPAIKASLAPGKKNPKIPVIKAEYANQSLKAAMGGLASISTGEMALKAASRYNEKGENVLMKYNPRIDVDFNDGRVVYADVPEIEIPTINFQFRPNDFDINSSRIVIQNSDFNLSGSITNLRRFMSKKGLLEGQLLFESSNTNVDELMAIVNGMGATDTTETATKPKKEIGQEAAYGAAINAEDALREPDPFMVPKGVDLSFTTKIHRATFSGTTLDSVQGRLTIKDGVAVVEQMGFTTDAAEMQLTGMYRSDRRNHLFAGLDFHLLNIDIKKLIEMIPSIDTIVPMLKSFEGEAQFHIAAETYLNARYEPKLSTLRAAAALEGKDLVLLDNETFSTIAKYMMFNKKTRNVVDSLSVEMTVFRDEVDLYPFLISMDKWQAVLSGRHNLDMSFNYHISLTDCPLPVRLGLDVKGTLDDLKFDLVPCKYKALYHPEKQKVTDKQTLALKKLISDSLKRNVKE